MGLGRQTGLERMLLRGRWRQSPKGTIRCCFCNAAIHAVSWSIVRFLSSVASKSSVPSFTSTGLLWQGRELLAISLQDAQHAWDAAVEEPCEDTLGPRYTGLQEIESLHRVITAAGRFQIRLVHWQHNIQLSSNGTAAHVRSVPEAGGARKGATEGGLSAVVFLHGFMGGPRDWRAVASALSLGCRCFAVELPGHGDSCAVDLPGRPHTPSTPI